MLQKGNALIVWAQEKSDCDNSKTKLQKSAETPQSLAHKKYDSGLEYKRQLKRQCKTLVF